MNALPWLRDWFKLPLYTVTIEIRVKKWKVTIIESSKTEHNTVNNQKFFPGLVHNNIIYEFIRIYLRKFVTFNAPNASCGQPILEHCGP